MTIQKRGRYSPNRSSDRSALHNFRRSAVSMAVAACLPGAMMLSTAATAQDEREETYDQLEEVIVTGVRASILGSVNSKRNADNIVDVVDAGILGALPDQSIGDALARLPGVTTVRDSGQSSQVNIRGMNGDFVHTTLNGREQPATSGYAEATRWTSFDQYPAELINQAAVYKSPKASLIEGGVAGTVELRLADPLEAPQDHNFSASARLSHNDAASTYGGDESGSRYSASYMGKFADDKIGVLAGYSFLNQPNAFVAARAGADNQLGYANVTSVDGAQGLLSPAFQWQAGNGDDERIGYMASLVLKPNDSIRAQLDYFRSDFDRGDRRQGITVGGLTQDAATANISNLTSDGRGLATRATVSAVDPFANNQSHPWFEARTEDQTTSAELESIGLNLRWDVSESSTLSLDVYTADGEKTREDRIVSMHAYDQAGNELTGTSFTYELDGQNIPNASFSGFSFTDPEAIRLSRYERYPHRYSDEIDSIKLDFTQNLEWGPLSSIEAGFRKSDRTFGAERGTFLYGSRSGQGNGWCEDNTSNIACAPQSVDGFVTTQSLEGVPDHFVITDIGALGESLFGPGGDAGVKLFSRDWTFIQSNDIVEDTEAFYLQANLDFQIGDMPVRGNVGLRHVKSDVKAVGLQNVGAGNGTPITDGVGVTQDNLAFVNYGPEYSDTLPSLNLIFELSENDIVRFAAAEVMGRPPVGQMSGGAGSWNGGTDPQTGLIEYNVWTNGTPFLDPFRAKQVDLSYEHYFEDGGAVTVAAFWKDIESLVEGPTQFTDVNAADLGINVPAGQFLNIYQTYLNNDLGGYVRGLELAATKTFDTLPGVFSGLGLTASYSYTQSETQVGGGTFYNDNLPLPGLSENVWSTTVFWDVGNFGSHVNVRYRDDFIQNLALSGANTAPARAQEYLTVDAQVSYAFDNGLSVVLSGNNLTDEENIVEYGVNDAFGSYNQFGRQFYLGINYKY